MDDNTRIVLLALMTLISAVVTPIVVVYVGRVQSKKIGIVEKKLDENHALTNGHLTNLLQTTKDLATATEKAKHTDKK